ncbi:protein of unknown function [Methylacidimicrobium sp. AP8]|nr:protein of unknown function [Methylacidimicrobium sp. AP8]
MADTGSREAADGGEGGPAREAAGHRDSGAGLYGGIRQLQVRPAPGKRRSSAGFPSLSAPPGKEQGQSRAV